MKGFFKGLFSLSNPHTACKAEVDSLYDLNGFGSGATLNDLNMEQQAEVVSYDYSGSVKDANPTQGKRSSTEYTATTIRNNSPDLPNEWGDE